MRDFLLSTLFRTDRSINVKLFYTCGAVIASNSDFSTEIIYSLWWESTPTQSCKGEETRIIPVRNQTGIDKSRNFTFWTLKMNEKIWQKVTVFSEQFIKQYFSWKISYHSIFDIKSAIFPLNWAININRVTQPVVWATPCLKFL